MGTLTLTQLKTEVRSALGNRTDLDDRLTIMLNLAQMRIARRNRWEELETLNTDNLTYNNDDDDRFLAKPANTRDIHSFVLLDGANSRKLKRRSPRMWDAIVAKPEYFSRGRPSHYVLYREIIELFRMPDSAYSVRLRISLWPTSFSDSSPTATSDLDHKDDMLIALSNSYAFSTLGDTERAGRWWVIYSNMLKDALREEEQEADLDRLPEAEMRAEVMQGEPWLDPFARSS